ncbi:MAG TPA: hypothetical protein DGG95_03110 [Cytophagales bacterium]|nr:hypothetical protein [Cytophagales bacterium]
MDVADDSNPIKFFEQFIQSKEALALATFFSGKDTGKKCLIDQNGKCIAGEVNDQVKEDLMAIFYSKKSHAKEYFLKEDSAEIFLELVQPTIHLLIFGGGFDARPVSKLAQSLGWNVQVTDECVAHLAPVFFPDTKLSLCQREFVDRDFEITPFTACVLMSHNYEYDRDVLKKLLPSSTPYVGILGPRKRFDKMMDEFSTTGLNLSSDDLLRIHSPIGLDIGAEAPDEIAVSIIAEIQAVFYERKGGFLKSLNGPIHKREATTDQVLKRIF